MWQLCRRWEEIHSSSAAHHFNCPPSCSFKGGERDVKLWKSSSSILKFRHRIIEVKHTGNVNYNYKWILFGKRRVMEKSVWLLHSSPPGAQAIFKAFPECLIKFYSILTLLSSSMELTLKDAGLLLKNAWWDLLFWLQCESNCCQHMGIKSGLWFWTQQLWTDLPIESRELTLQTLCTVLSSARSLVTGFICFTSLSSAVKDSDRISMQGVISQAFQDSLPLQSRFHHFETCEKGTFFAFSLCSTSCL